MSPLLHGRIWLDAESKTAQLFSEAGAPVFPLDPETAQTTLSRLESLQGGIVRVALDAKQQIQRIDLLTPNRSDARGAKRSDRFRKQILDPRRLRALKRRTEVEREIRHFFESRGFWEARTPKLVPCPGMETHIRPFRVASASRGSFAETQAYLPTSPEFALKRLLVGGLEKIFELAPAFRDEPPSITHQPEFLMLEWYRAYAGESEIQADTEALIAHLATTLLGKTEITYQGHRIDVSLPWPRYTVSELFLKHAGIDLTQAQTSSALAFEAQRLGLNVPTPLSENQGSWPESWDDVYFSIWLNVIEPKLPVDRAFFVTRYPASQAALACLTEPDSQGVRWAKRFEAYLGGIEICNAFEELTDPDEQRARFVRDMQLRAEHYGPDFPPSPLDEDFLAALGEGLPPSGGNALGVDRLVMLFSDEPDIRYVSWLPKE